jgi:drug/metabolite transporter (DMT)-like permease
MSLILSGNAPVALAAAAAWGGGDFSGGMGVKAAGGTTAGALRLVILAHAVSLAVLVMVLWASGAAWPHGSPMWWGLAAGVAGGISLTAFYIALSHGAMGASAAVSGLIAAAIPAIVSGLMEGPPGPVRVVGFVLALVAIWMIAAGPSPENVPDSHGRLTMALAVVGGVGFGIYFVALRMANPLGTVEPMALARAGSLVTCMLLLAGFWVAGRAAVGRVEVGPMLFWAAGVALLDTGGNLLFTMATRLGRLDVAAVLASLYPASTILLAAWRLHERPTRRQVLGMVVALVAVVAITV